MPHVQGSARHARLEIFIPLPASESFKLRALHLKGSSKGDILSEGWTSSFFPPALPPAASQHHGGLGGLSLLPPTAVLPSSQPCVVCSAPAPDQTVPLSGRFSRREEKGVENFYLLLFARCFYFNKHSCSFTAKASSSWSLMSPR